MDDTTEGGPPLGGGGGGCSVVVLALLLLVACFAFGCSEIEAVVWEVALGTDSYEPVAGFLVWLLPVRLLREYV